MAIEATGGNCRSAIEWSSGAFSPVKDPITEVICEEPSMSPRSRERLLGAGGNTLCLPASPVLIRVGCESRGGEPVYL
jgi:hypothetical protein